MSEEDILARVRELGMQQVIEYLLTGEFDPKIESRLRRLQHEGENLKPSQYVEADFSGIYEVINRRKVSDSN